MKEKTGNGLSTSNYGSRQNTSDDNRKAKKSMFSKMDSLKVCSAVICATIFLKVSTIDCLSDHTSESTSTTTPTPSTSGEYFTSILRMKELAILEQSMVAEMYKVLKTGELRQEGLSKIKT